MIKHSRQLVYCREIQNSRWDHFVFKSNGDVQQTSVWYAHSGRKAVRFYLMENEEIIAGCQLLEQNYPLLGKMGVIERGPCFRDEGNELYHWFIETVQNLSAKEKYRYLAIVPDYNTDQLIECLQQKGFFQKSKNFPPNPTVRSTLMLDLKPSLEEILGQMKKTRRKSIIKGLASPVSYRIGGRDDIPVFFDLMLETCVRRNAQPIISSVDVIFRLWDNLAPNGWMVLFLGIVNERPVCASIGIISGRTYRNWLWGWTGEYTNYCVSETMDWKTLEWAKSNGCQWYDFLHVDTISANVIAASETVSEEVKRRSHFGSTFYKMQYGGKVIHYPDIYYYFPRKIDYFIFHVVGERLMKLQSIKKLAFMIRTKSKIIFIRKMQMVN